MKRIAALVVSLSFALALTAQKNERTTAYMSMGSYNRSKDKVAEAYYLDRAKVAIDKATVHPDTKDDASTWVYRGQIYMLLYLKEFNEKLAAHSDVTDAAKKAAIGYLETPPANLYEATNAFLKAKALDTKKFDEDAWARGLGDCYFYLNQSGIVRFNQKQFAEAYPMFSLAADITASSKKFDTLNTSNAALAAYNAKMYDKSILHYQKLTASGFGKGQTWMLLAQNYLESGDSAKYIATISDGLKKYPNDEALLAEDVNLKMKNGQMAAAIEQLNALIAQRPEDSQLNLVVGQVYDHLANPDPVNGEPVARPKNYDELFLKAEGYYKKAIELDPKNFDALYCLGVLYYNQSIEYYNRSQSTIAEAAKYKTLWEKPLPEAAKVLEQAYLLNSKDLNLLLVLQNVYSQMGDEPNYMRLKEEIKKVRTGG